MKYAIRTFLGLALMIGAAVACGYSVYHIVQIGSCSSGGSGFSASKLCPPGTGKVIMLLIGGIFASIAGAGIYGLRGDPPGEKAKHHIRGGVLMWVSLFLSLAFGFAWSVWGPDANAGSGWDTVGLILGGVFAIMALAALPGLVASGAASDGAGYMVTTEIGQAMKSASAFRRGQWGASQSSSDVDRLERATKLYAQGAITKEEFDRIKDKVIDEE